MAMSSKIWSLTFHSASNHQALLGAAKNGGDKLLISESNSLTEGREYYMIKAELLILVRKYFEFKGSW